MKYFIQTLITIWETLTETYYLYLRSQYLKRSTHEEIEFDHDPALPFFKDLENWFGIQTVDGQKSLNPETH